MTYCPNMNFGYYKTAKEKYDLDTAYYLDVLLRSQVFLDWQKSSDTPVIDENLIAHSPDGRRTDLKEVLDKFYLNNKLYRLKNQQKESAKIEAIRQADNKRVQEIKSKKGSKQSQLTSFLKKETKFLGGIISEDSAIKYSQRLKAFNDKYGTSHRFQKEYIGEKQDNLRMYLLENWNGINPFQTKLFKEQQRADEYGLFESENYSIDLFDFVDNLLESHDFAFAKQDMLPSYKGNDINTLLNDLSNSKSPIVSELMSVLGDKMKVKQIFFYTNDSNLTEADKLKSALGYYGYTNKTIGLNIGQIRNKAELLQVLLHELAHSATIEKIYNLSHGIGSEEEIKIYTQLNALREHVKGIEGYGDLYGLSNTGEFVSEILTNSEFVSKLNAIKYGETTILERVYDYLMRLLGIKSGTAASEGFRLAMKIVDMSSKQDTVAPEIKDKVAEAKVFKTMNDLVSTLENIKEHGSKFIDSEDKSQYVNKDNPSESYNRLHTALNEINPDVEMAKGDQFDTIARRIFKNRNKSIESDTIKYAADLEEMNFAELKKYLEIMSRVPIVRGNIIHEIIQNPDKYSTLNDVENNPDFVSQAEEVGLDLKSLSWLFFRVDEDDDTSESYLGRITRELGLDEDLASILAGTNSLKVFPELRIVNEDMGLGSTADIVVARSNGTVSLYELKSGNSLLRSGMDDALITKYAKKHKLRFSKLTQAQLQVMTNAIGLRAKDRSIKFSNIDVIYLNYRHMKSGFPIRISTFDKQKTLDILADYFKEKNPTWYAKNTDLFKYENYGELSYEFQREVAKYSLNNANELSSLYAEQTRQLSYVVETMKRTMRVDPDQKLYMTGTKLNSLSIQEAETMRQDLAKKILQIESRGRADFDAKANTSWLMSNFGNKRYIGNKLLTRVRMFIEKGRRDFEDQRFDLYRQEQDLFKPIYDEYLSKHPTKKALAKISMEAINTVKYKDLFDFMWDDTENGKYFVTEKSSKWNNLTDAQKKYSRFVRLNIMKEFYRTMHPQSLISILESRIQGDNYDSETIEEYRKIVEEFKQLGNIYINKLSGLPRFEHYQTEWDDSFAPRVPHRLSEQYEHVGGISNSLKFTRDVVKKSFQDPLDVISNDNQLMSGMQLKYMGSAKMIENENFTLNSSIAFFQFISNVVAKRNLDDSYAVARTFRDMHALGDNLSNEDFKATAKIIDDVLINNLILQKPRQKVEQTQVITAMRMATSLAYIGFRYASGIKNGVFEFLNNIRKAIVGTVSPNSNPDFTLKDMSVAMGLWLKYKYDGIKNPSDNKLHNILKRYKLDTDDFEYRVRKQDLIGVKNRVMDIGLAFKTHSVFESFTNQTAAIAQMIHNDTWNKHDDKGNWIGGIRAVTETADGVKKQITGLTYQEVERMRSVGEQLHGGYREDEKSSIEFTFLGDLAMQFHKYIPSYINVTFSGAYNKEELGKWIQTGEFTIEDGKVVPVWEWESVLFEGEVPTSAKVIGTFFRRMVRDLFAIDAISYDPNYQWKNLSYEQKKAVRSLITRIAMYGALYMCIAAAFSGVPDSDRWKKQWKQLPDDVLGGLNVPDMTRAIDEPIIAFGMAKEVAMGLKEFLINGAVFGERLKSGKNKGKLKGTTRLYRFLPFRSLYLDLEDKYDW